jgi:hypothetical protein
MLILFPSSSLFTILFVPPLLSSLMNVVYFGHLKYEIPAQYAPQFLDMPLASSAKE